jgi:orotate phosphoribosyltransferase
MLPSFPLYFKLTINAMKKIVASKISENNFDTFASIPTSGLIFGSSLAYEMSKPFVYVRKGLKEYGTSKLIEGHLASGARVVLVDDVITTGISMSHAVDVIRTNGGIVEYIVVLVDRQEGAEALLKKTNVNLASVTTVRDIVNALNQAGLIDNNTLASVIGQMTSQGDYENE